jgi:hypothetical protein
MVDIAITPANVVAGSNAVTESGIAGVAINAGQVVYKDTETGKYLLADSNNPTDAEGKSARGIALHASAINQPLKIHKAGDITIGGTLVAGVAYYLSDTPGGICPEADVGAGEQSTILGMAKTTGILTVDIQTTGVTK